MSFLSIPNLFSYLRERERERERKRDKLNFSYQLMDIHICHETMSSEKSSTLYRFTLA